MDDEAPRLVYNPDDGSVELRVGGRSVTVDGLDAEVVFERMTPDGDAAAPLWLAQGEADVLRKMIRHILARVRITEESKATLAELLPRVEAIADADGDGEGPGGGGRNDAGRGPGQGPGGASADRPSRDASSGDRSGRDGPADDGPRRGAGGINVPGVRRGMPSQDDDVT